MYDFQSIIDRRGASSSKWDQIREDMGPGNDDVIALSVADMEFATAPQIAAALVQSAQHDVLGYDRPTDGYFEALADWMRRRHRVGVARESVSLSDGVMPAVYTALRAVTRPGDRVIIQRPVYPPFTMAAERNGLTILDNTLILGDDGRYVMDYEDLEAKASDPRCTAIILCNPHNPVGRVWTADELRRLGDICIQHGVAILSDEIHADFARPGHEVSMFAALGEPYTAHCFDFTAPTKTFNIAGLPCSNVIIPNPELKRAFDIAAQNISGLTPSHFALVACQAAYNGAEAWLDELQQVLETNRAVLRDFTAATPGVDLIEPEGTYLGWLDCRGLGMTASELRDFMRGRARVYFDEGAMFGRAGEGFERINLACPTALLHRALDGVTGALEALR